MAAEKGPRVTAAKATTTKATAAKAADAPSRRRRKPPVEPALVAAADATPVAEPADPAGVSEIEAVLAPTALKAPQTPAVIIYVPGLGEADNAVDGFSQRLSSALDQESPDPRARYRVQPPDPRSGMAQTDTAPRQIVRDIDGESELVAHVFPMAYETKFRRRFETASQATRALLLGQLVLYMLVFQLPKSLMRRRRRGQKSGKACAEAVFALSIFLALFAYMVILFAAVLEAMYRASQSHELGMLQYAALGLTALTAVVPGKIRNMIASAAADYYSASNYLATGDNRSNQVSSLSKLLETVVEIVPDDAPIFIVGYSFGSIITLDAMFPLAADRPARLERVTGIVTMGCPYDLVRAVWPAYYGRRAGEQPDLWLNIFAPLDVLSSNFIDGDDAATEPAKAPPRRRRRIMRRARETPAAWAGIGLRQGAEATPRNVLWDNGSPGERLTWLKVLAFTGIKAHTMYWDVTDFEDVGCIRAVATALAGRAPVLLAQPDIDLREPRVTEPQRDPAAAPA